MLTQNDFLLQVKDADGRVLCKTLGARTIELIVPAAGLTIKGPLTASILGGKLVLADSSGSPQVTFNTPETEGKRISLTLCPQEEST